MNKGQGRIREFRLTLRFGHAWRVIPARERTLPPLLSRRGITSRRIASGRRPLLSGGSRRTLRIFKPRRLQRFARKGGIADAVLREAAARAEKRQIDAGFGGGSSNSRSPGRGISKGYRTILLFRRGGSPAATQAFFVYRFAKSRRPNIDDNEEEQFREAAKRLLALTEKQLAELLRRSDFLEANSE